MVVIRLSRSGAKKRPFYHIVAADSRRARDGRFIEQLGYYNPGARGQETPLKLDLERVQYWIGTGAKASDRVNFLIKQAKKTVVTETATAEK
jgi:small subunit ribosomal protein S16